MIPLAVSYATPSAYESDRDRALLGLTANARRPVRFHGRVRESLFPFRAVLQALGQVIWSDDTWLSSSEYVSILLDPVVTVHDDRVFFEAFSADQSTYGLVIADRGLFETEGEVRTGTTNVDFTAMLWAALAEMRSSRETWIRIEAGGVEVATTGAGGRFERKVDLPDPWVRGFLQLQGAMTLPGTRLRCRPVDLLAVIRTLATQKAKVSPRALRYEMEPGQDAVCVLEPWERIVRLKGSEHGYTEKRVIRTWGRRRLRLLEPLLPYADSVSVYLKGRALPSFYAVRLGEGLTFVLGLSGWTAQGWTREGSFDLLGGIEGVDEGTLARTAGLVSDRVHVTEEEAARLLGVERPVAARALSHLCRRGRAIFDVEKREFRHRELFETPIDEARLFPPDQRVVRARELVASRAVLVEGSAPRETRRERTFRDPRTGEKLLREVIHRDWHVSGRAGAGPSARACEIVLNDSGRIIFGTCACAFFQENALNQGPCEHMLALFAESEASRRDLPTSVEAERPAPPAKARRQREAASEEDGDEAGETEEDEAEPEGSGEEET